ncbi:ABC transporter permease [Streptosporangium saharense]|uniref:ABC-type transport system involved in multi-copper enzyme maturation permease subunit n=1 Tax=Streptosporangium saharense TaxID=1706840 RepID=A0A7W7QR93_9ACTN|nr:ABC transporter permease [Streptosporangium saharense]MBB4918158.1 ABC-type transport system involved in multi-copper enzyme maturation permease subunit [Streptosporangium saharense]
MIDVMRSEWTKMRSVRSTVWTLGSVPVLMVALAVVGALATVGAGDAGRLADPVSTSLRGIVLASLVTATLGVIAISGEYRTGAIRTSLVAVPGRLRFLAAKAVVLTAVTLVVGVASAFAAFLAGRIAFAGRAGEVSLADPGVSRAVFGAGLYLAASGLFGLALGVLVRHTPGAIVTVCALLMVLPTLVALVPGELGRRLLEFTASNAGSQVAVVHPTGMGPWTGFAVYLAWVALPLAAGAVLLGRRDA